jgi:pimeloyl-ACP methyl ester carboxylesterase
MLLQAPRALPPRTARVLRAAAPALVAGAGGFASAAAFPRGPVTGAGVLVAMVSAGALGWVAGFLARSRWAILVAPLAFAACYELGRLDVVGPSVDRPRLDTSIGVLVLVLGRGFGALTQLLPVALGAAFGAGAARRRRPGTADAPSRVRVVLRRSRRTVAALTVVALAVLGVVLLRPGTTAPIVDAAGAPVPGSVAELARVRLGGHEQTVLIRARDVSRPVLLYLAGGPGQSDLGYTRAYMPTLEDDTVFAVWDQRGTGTSYAALDPARTWTLDRAVADTIELTEYLRDRFGRTRIYLFGNSWGSIIGTLAAQRRPDLYAAYIGAGQMVDPRATDREIYAEMRALAERTGDTARAQRLREAGLPPYEDVYRYVEQILAYEDIGPYAKTDWFENHGPTGIDGNGAREYGPLDKVNKLKALFDMGSVMYPQIQDVDFRRQVPRLEVPVYLVQGAHELPARLTPAREWYAALDAPQKQWVTFEASGHIPQFEEYARFQALLREIVARHGA